MGNHDLGRQIGIAAQAAYENRRSDEAAIHILDNLCKGRGADAEWEAEDPENPGNVHPEIGHYTDPNPAAGLGMLMLEAFAPDGTASLSRYHGVNGYRPTGDPETDCLLERAAEKSTDLWWEEVYKPFNRRYLFY